MDDVSLTQAEYALLLRGHTWIRSVDPHASLSRGWAGIVVDMLDVLGVVMDEVTTEHPHAHIVDFTTRSKLGRLRVHFALAGVSGPADAARRLLHAIVDRAEARSAKICERCGAPGRLRVVDDQLITLCDAHAAEEA